MAFDYIDLIPPVRRLVNDEVKTDVEEIASTTTSSYYVRLSQDGIVIPLPSGVIVDGTVKSSSDYSMINNIMKFKTLIPAGTAITVEYQWADYTDSTILDFIDDAIHQLVEPILNIDLAFSGTTTDEEVGEDLQTLIVYGTAVKILGLKLTSAGDDAIYIKDGDTTINTAVSSQEQSKGFAPILDMWNMLLHEVRTNRFDGVTMY